MDKGAPKKTGFRVLTKAEHADYISRLVFGISAEEAGITEDNPYAPMDSERNPFLSLIKKSIPDA
jgi:hypothetical protein